MEDANFESAGSPPPMRGKVRCPHRHAFRSGITPAYAGKSACDMRTIVARKDHPRLCGEKDTDEAFYQTDDRITPAYAGKSYVPAEFCLYREDHPRLCGEKAAHSAACTG